MFTENPIAEFRGPWAIPVQLGASLMILPLFVLLNGISAGALLAGALFILVLVLAILLHELGHAWACRICGIPVRRIMISGAGGFTEQGRSSSRSQDELIVAMGPIVNLVIWAAGSLALDQIGFSALGWLGPVAYMVVWINFYIAVFNLLPVIPLDGGRLLNLFLNRVTSPRTAARISGTVGMIAILLWIPMMYYSWRHFGFVLLFLPSINLHWQMMNGERM
jgi:stage IV sporulation protein FB